MAAARIPPGHALAFDQVVSSWLSSLVVVSTWDAVDDLVLRWLFAQDSNPDWDGRLRDLVLRPTPEPQTAFDDDLDARQVDEALTRLKGYGLLVGERHETTHYAYWSQLRLTADGLVVLGEWPDLDRVASAQGMVALLTELAEEATDTEDQRALRKAAGSIGRLGDAVVNSVLESAGSQIAE